MISTPRQPCWDGKTQMAWVYNDGGRAAAGFKGRTGDCVCRSIAIATGRPYREIYTMIERLGALETRHRLATAKRRSSARTGVHKPTTRVLLTTLLGWTWVPTMGIGTGATVGLCEEDLPMGRLIVQCSRHLTAVIDRVIHDTYDPQRGTLVSEPGKPTRIARRCVYGYYQKSSA